MLKKNEDIYEIDLPIPDINSADFYHGLAPAFTAEVIKLLIQKGGFRNLSILLHFLSKYKAYYNWVFPVEQNKANKADTGIEEYYIYTVLKMSSHFGYTFSITKNTKPVIERIIKDNADGFIPDITYKWDAKGNLILIGGPCWGRPENANRGREIKAKRRRETSTRKQDRPFKHSI